MYYLVLSSSICTHYHRDVFDLASLGAMLTYIYVTLPECEIEIVNKHLFGQVSKIKPVIGQRTFHMLKTFRFVTSS